MASEQLPFPFEMPPEAEAAPLPTRTAGKNTRGSRPQPFHYTDAMGEVVRDIVRTLDEFRHVDLDRVLVSIAQARQASRHGTYASCFPMRFENGAQEAVFRKKRFRMPSLLHEGREILYVLYFMLPRFHEEQDYPAKLATIIHELYHISPLFNGDIRRFPGKNFAHGHSREVYHAAMCKLAGRYLALSPQAEAHEFLKVPFSELLKRPGGVVGFSVTRPKAVLVPSPAPEKGRKRR
jgi:hypothetical protein